MISLEWSEALFSRKIDKFAHRKQNFQKLFFKIEINNLFFFFLFLVNLNSRAEIGAHTQRQTLFCVYISIVTRVLLFLEFRFVCFFSLTTIELSAVKRQNAAIVALSIHLEQCEAAKLSRKKITKFKEEQKKNIIRISI